MSKKKFYEVNIVGKIQIKGSTKRDVTQMKITLGKALAAWHNWHLAVVEQGKSDLREIVYKLEEKKNVRKTKKCKKRT